MVAGAGWKWIGGGWECGRAPCNEEMGGEETVWESCAEKG